MSAPLCLLAPSCPTLCGPMGCSPPGSSGRGDSPGKNTSEYCSGLPCPPPGDLPNPGVEPRSPTLQADALPSEPLGKSRNTGVGSLSLLQGNFPTPESNRGFLHCRQILYQLSYQGSPAMREIQVQSLSWEDSLGEGNGYSLQCSCLENSMDRGAWRATVHGVTKSQT